MAFCYSVSLNMEDKVSKIIFTIQSWMNIQLGKFISNDRIRSLMLVLLATSLSFLVFYTITLVGFIFIIIGIGLIILLFEIFLIGGMLSVLFHIIIKKRKNLEIELGLLTGLGVAILYWASVF